jgi:hypothetical protein
MEVGDDDRGITRERSEQATTMPALGLDIWPIPDRCALERALVVDHAVDDERVVAIARPRVVAPQRLEHDERQRQLARPRDRPVEREVVIGPPSRPHPVEDERRIAARGRVAHEMDPKLHSRGEPTTRSGSTGCNVVAISYDRVGRGVTLMNRRSPRMLAFVAAASAAGCAADSANAGAGSSGSSGGGSSDGSTSAASADTTSTTGEPQPPTEPEILFESPAGAFFESVVVAGDGTVYFTDTTNAKVFRSVDGNVTEYATLDDHPGGLGIDSDGTIYFTAIQESLFELAEPFVATNAIYAADGEGGATLVLDAPQAGFLNGMALLAPGVFLVTDSSASTIWRFDVEAGALDPWLEHDLLAPVAGLVAPGANGVKIVGDTAYVSNTSHLQLLQIPIDASLAAGEPTTAIVGAVIDDFAFGASGAIYAATHIADVVRVELGGMPETIAGGSDGVIGSTAVAFGRSGWDDDAIYVVTDGGLFAADGDASAAGPARLVLVPVGEPAG